MLQKRFEKDRFSLDYLIYSSHKTGTQSLVRTLKSNKFISLHLHTLANIGMEEGSFQEYLKNYSIKNNKKLSVITVFREPIERHISSFFQGYGSRPLRLKQVKSETETIIFKHSIAQLHEKFISELTHKTLIGYSESISEICQELHIATDELPRYDEEKQYSIYETEYIRLYIIRFDILINDFEGILSKITGKPIEKRLTNLSNLKWYKDIYLLFKESLAVPHSTILEAYHAKHKILSLLYAADFETLLQDAYSKYGSEKKRS